MKIKEIRESTKDELAARERELRNELFHLRIQQQSGQIENPSQIRSARREVARIKTVLNEKLRAEAAQTAK